MIGRYTQTHKKAKSFEIPRCPNTNISRVSGRISSITVSNDVFPDSKDVVEPKISIKFHPLEIGWVRSSTTNHYFWFSSKFKHLFPQHYLFDIFHRLLKQHISIGKTFFRKNIRVATGCSEKLVEQNRQKMQPALMFLFIQLSLLQN